LGYRHHELVAQLGVESVVRVGVRVRSGHHELVARVEVLKVSN
jgi:hypothetical protein